MKKKNLLCLVLVAAAVLILLYFLLPRSFAQVIGGGFDPARVDQVDVLLTKIDETGDHTSTPLQEEVSRALLEKLNRRRYFLLPGTKPFWEITLGYEVHLGFSYNDCTEYAYLFFCGDSEMDLQRTGRPHHRAIRVSGDNAAFQRELLELLLTAEQEEG